MELTSKLNKALSSEKWYHATTKEHFENICKTGVCADFNRGKELDFGFGFYLTTTEKMAESYLCRLYGSLDIDTDISLVVMEYSFNPVDWLEKYKFVSFEQFDDSFAEFVFKNRLESKSKEQRHDFDFIYGVMSDSLPTQLLLGYRAGDLTKDEVIDKLKKGNSMKQLSIHNQELCDLIILNRAYEFNPQTNERKELDIL